MYKWHKDRNRTLDNKLNIKVGHIQVIRMQHERFGLTAKEIAKHYRKAYRWDYRFIQSILDYRLWPEVKPLGTQS